MRGRQAGTHLDKRGEGEQGGPGRALHAWPRAPVRRPPFARCVGAALLEASTNVAGRGGGKRGEKGGGGNQTSGRAKKKERERRIWRQKRKS